MKTIEGNKLIAQFMGFAPHENWWIIVPNETLANVSSEEVVEELEFHYSWDWLMPVVEKIEQTICEESGYGFDVRIEGNYCIIQDGEHDKIYADNMVTGDDPKYVTGQKIVAVWDSVVEFIEWYNENK